MKKLAIVGKGTVGSLAIGNFLKDTDWEIDWIFDSNAPTTAVGEGTQAVVPAILWECFGWTWNDLHDIHSTVKTGVHKVNWGKKNKTFTHPFPTYVSGIHFNAIEFQEKVFKTISNNPRVNVIDKLVTDPHELDADHVLVCSGTPKDFSEYNIHNNIPVNSAYVTQCYWDNPRFDHTLTIARPYGWVFGIPLLNRCSIGYLYNKEITKLEDVKEDVKNIFKEYNLEPSNVTNSLSFKNYSRKKNFTNKVVYNGNASFFLEPLEATSTTQSYYVNRNAYALWNGLHGLNEAESTFKSNLSNIESMICLHYMAGSQFENEFWKYAQELGQNKIKKEIKNKTIFIENLIHAMDKNYEQQILDIGTWPRWSYDINTEHLGITDELKKMTAGLKMEMLLGKSHF